MGRITKDSLTREQLIDGITNEWEYLIHDDFEEGDPTVEERRAELEQLTREQLLNELDREEGEDLDRFVELYL